MKGNTANFSLQCSLREFIFLFWENEEQHVDFLSTKLMETEIVITKWDHDKAATNVLKSASRTVSVMHPLPIQLPWLPLHIQNRCHQTIKYTNQNSSSLTIVERSAINGIPFVQPYLICTWNITEHLSSSLTPFLSISTNVEFDYDMYTLLQSQVEYWSNSAMHIYFTEWEPHANAILNVRRQQNLHSLVSAVEDRGTILRRFWPPGSASQGVGDDDLITSDDFGDTWRSSGGVPADKDNAVEQMSSGRKESPNSQQSEAEVLMQRPARATFASSAHTFLECIMGIVFKIFSSLVAAHQSRVVDSDEHDQRARQISSRGSSDSDNLREETENARMLSAQRPFLSNKASTSDKSAAGGASKDEKKRRIRGHKSAVSVSAPTPEALKNPLNGLMCSLDIANLLKLPKPGKRPSIAQVPAGGMSGSITIAPV